MIRVLAIVVTALSALTIATPAHADSRASRGMGQGNGPCMALATSAERALMRPESRGWPTADNPRSTAFGCGQLLAFNRRKFAGRCHTHASTLNPLAQMCLMRAYVRARFGTGERALAFRRRNGFY